MDRFHQELTEGEVLFEQGEPGSSAFVVESGQLRVVLRSEDGDQELALLGPGDVIGEMALLTEQPRSAAAIATQTTLLRIITRAHLAERMEEADPLLRHLLKMVAHRLQNVLGLPPPEDGALSGNAEDSDETDHESALHRVRMEQELELALENGELLLYFQPITRVADERVSGFEALIRWNKPGEGLIPPNIFIPISEESQVIEKIGRWILHEGCRACRLLDDACAGNPGAIPLTMSLNLSARQFLDQDTLSSLAQSMREFEVNPQQIRLEVVESQILKDWDTTIRMLETAKAMGNRIAIDDFGTGYSSLAYLNKLPVDTLKIDQVFVRNVESDTTSQTIIAAVATLAKGLGMSYIAEGVETRQQAQLVGKLGVEYIQGYLYGKPMPLNDALEYVRIRNSDAFEPDAG